MHNGTPIPPVPAPAPAPALPDITAVLHISGTQATPLIAAHKAGITVHTVGRALLQWATSLLLGPDGVYASEAQKLEAHRRAGVTRDYPAAIAYPSARVQLCAACADLYGSILEGPAIPVDQLGLTAPVPCTYHLAPERRPEPLGQALTRRNLEDPPEEVS